MEAITQGPGRAVIMVCVFILLGLAIYNLYQWLSGSGELKDMVVFSDPSTGMLAMSTSGPTIIKGVDLPPLYGGGEYSVSVWIYITNWGINKLKNKVFLTLSGGSSGESGYNTLVLYLGQNLNKLGVRVSYESSSTVGASNLLNSVQMDKITNAVTPYTDAAGDFKKCDIESIDLQRWVNITTVLSGRTTDIYIDGKLSRSCVMDGMFKVDADTPTLKLGGQNGFGGYIGMTRAANFAYSPDQVYKHYQSGPLASTWGSWLSALTSPGNIAITVTKNGKPLFQQSNVATN
jgi:Concanavalin A-like lectin/glucanases superfamily